MGTALRVRFRQLAYRLRSWLRSVVYEWPHAMRVVTDDGCREIARVIRHEITPTHLIVEDIDGCLYLWRLAEVRRYGPMRKLDLPGDLFQKPLRVVG